MAFSGRTVWRDFVTDGVPSSGDHDPNKKEVRDWAAWLESLIRAVTSVGGKIYASRAAMNADLTPVANTPALVIGDPVAANNGIYMKVGAAGSGSWIRLGDVPGYQFVRAENAGTGNPNAIIATSVIPVSGDVLVYLPIATTNTGSPVTVSFNGGPALTVKTNSGNDVSAGGLTAGMIVLGVMSGASFRLVSDQVSSAIVAAAEAAAARAESAALSVEALSPTARLAAFHNPTPNANDAKASGFYYSGVGARSGWPDDTKIWVMIVMSSDLDGFVTRYAYRSHAGAVFETFQQKVNAGTFSQWEPVVESRAAVVSAVREVSPYVDLAEFGQGLGATDDWRPAFNAAVAKVASVSPKIGAKIRLPLRQIYLSYVDRITANGITFVGQGKTQIQSATDGEIIGLDTPNSMFAWGSVSTETCGGGLDEVSIEASALTWTDGHLISCINARGPQFRKTWTRKPYNFAKVTGGNDVEFQDNHVGGYRGEGLQISGTDTLRGDRAVLNNNFIGGWSNDGYTASNVGPALYINGNWHSVYSTGRLEMVTVNEGVKIDSPYSDNAMMPQFIDIADLLVDYTTNNALSYNKGEHCWVRNAYMNGGQNNLIGFGAGAADLQISGGKIGYAQDRLGIIEGLGFLLTGTDCHRWNQRSNLSSAFLLRASANDVRFRNNMAGRTGKLGVGSEAGQKFLTVEAGANSYQADGNTFIGLHATPMDGTIIAGNRSRA